jgi:hypothetical protein
MHLLDSDAMLSGMTGSEIEVFRGTGGDLEQTFYESALREAEINYFVKSEGVAQHPVNVGPMSSFVILVGPEDEDRARELIVELQEARSVDDQTDDDEPQLFLGSSKPTALHRKGFLALGVVSASTAAYLLVPFRDASVVGIVLLPISLIFFAASRRP